MQGLNKPILLYDGLCHFCDGSVQWILKNDKQEQIVFSPLQSEYAQQILKNLKQPLNLESAVFVANGLVYKKAKAIFKVMTYLGGIWTVAGHLLFAIPSIFTDPIYSLVAKNRYRIAGNRSECRIPSANQQKRFFLD